MIRISRKILDQSVYWAQFRKLSRKLLTNIQTDVLIFSEKSFFSASQFGFRNKSCVQAISNVPDYIREEIHIRSYHKVCSIDMKKAFGTFDFKILLPQFEIFELR